MTRAMEHCDDKNSGALWWHVSWSIVMKLFIVHRVDKGEVVLWWNWSSSIVITEAIEHCDDRHHGALWRKESWGIVMTIEKCDENGQQAKWLKWSFRNVMKNYIEHCDDKGHGALWGHGHGTLWWQEFCRFVMTRAMEHTNKMPLHPQLKMVQPLWKTVWSFLKKLKIELTYDPAIPLLGMYPEKTIIWKDTVV